MNVALRTTYQMVEFNKLLSIPKSSHLTKLSRSMGKRLVRVPSPGSHKRDKCSQTRFGGKRGRWAGQMPRNRTSMASTSKPKIMLQRATRDGGRDKIRNPASHGFSIPEVIRFPSFCRSASQKLSRAYLDWRSSSNLAAGWINIR